MPENRRLVNAVEKALKENETTAKAKRVHVRAVSGVVFLDGEVESEEEKAAVVELVKGVDGVHMVRDRLQVSPETRAGAWRDQRHHEE